MNDADCTRLLRNLETIEEGTHMLVNRIAELEAKLRGEHANRISEGLHLSLQLHDATLSKMRAEAELKEETALRRQAMDENEVKDVEIERLADESEWTRAEMWRRRANEYASELAELKQRCK